MQSTYIAALVLAVLLAVAAGGVWAVATPEKSVPVRDTVNLETPRVKLRVPPAGYENYWNEEYQFSLFYPKNFSVSETPHTDRRVTIVFQDTNTYEGFQIYITPYFSEFITDEQFKKDVPSGVRDNILKTKIDDVEAVQFESEDAEFGKTSELWFIKYGYLYEVTTYQELPHILESVRTNWKFY